MHIAATCVGMAQRLLAESVAHAQSSRQGGHPISEFQLVQAMLADIQTGVYAGRAMVAEAARNYDSGADRRIGPSAAKLLYRDARLFRIYEGTSEIQRLIIGRTLVRDGV